MSAHPPGERRDQYVRRAAARGPKQRARPPSRRGLARAARPARSSSSRAARAGSEHRRRAITVSSAPARSSARPLLGEHARDRLRVVGCGEQRAAPPRGARAPRTTPPPRRGGRAARRRRAERGRATNSRTSASSENHPTSCRPSSRKRPRRASESSVARAPLDPERLAQLGRERVERRDVRTAPAPRLARARRPRPRGKRRAARPGRAGAAERLLALGGRHARSASIASRTAAGQPPVARPARRGARGGVGPASSATSRRRSRPRENASSAPVELEHLALPAQPRRSGTAARRATRARGGSAAAPRGRAPRRSAPAPRDPAELVDVVEHEHEVRAGALGERVREGSDVRLRPGSLIGVCVRPPGAAEDGREPRRQPGIRSRSAWTIPACERRELGVLGGHAVPGAVDLRRPRGEQRRLAEPGARDDGRQPPRAAPRRAAPRAAVAARATAARPAEPACRQALRPADCARSSLRVGRLRCSGRVGSYDRARLRSIPYLPAGKADASTARRTLRPLETTTARFGHGDVRRPVVGATGNRRARRRPPRTRRRSERRGVAPVQERRRAARAPAGSARAPRGRGGRSREGDRQSMRRPAAPAAGATGRLGLALTAPSPRLSCRAAARPRLQWARLSPVAQLAEHPAVNRRVVGSSPTRGVTALLGRRKRLACLTGDPGGELGYGARIVRRSCSRSPVAGQGSGSRNRSGSSRRVPTRIALVAVLGLLLAALLPLSAAVAAPNNACDNRTNNTYEKLLECVTLEGVREHQAQFQRDRRQQRRPVLPRDPGGGHRRLRGQRRLRRWPAGGRRLPGDARPVRVPVRVPGAAAATHPGQCRLRDGNVHQQRVR